MAKLRVGVIGAGAIASCVHIPIMKRRSDLFEVVALADLNIEAVNVLAERFGIPERYDSAFTMIEKSKLDMVAVVNSGKHADFVVAALKAGIDVFCEKPLAYTHIEMDEIEAAMKSSGRKLMIGYMKTFDPAVYAAAAEIKDSRARTVDVVVLHPSGESQLATTDLSVDIPKAPANLIPVFQKSALDVQTQALGSKAAAEIGNLYTDIIMGSVIHEFSVLRSLDVHIEHVDYVDRWPKTPKTESIIIAGRTADGVRVTIRWFYLDQYPMYQEEVRWVNENEGHHIIFSSPYILRVPTKYIKTTREGLDHKETTFNSYVASFENELEAFHRYVETGTQQTDPIKAGREDMVLSQKIASAILDSENIEKGGELKR